MKARPPHEHEPLHPAAIRDAASGLGVELSPAQAERLGRFAALLLKWNKVYNLTSRATPPEVLTHHLLDSLAVAPELAHAIAARGSRVLDVGAGGGLPGIPLAIALPALSFTLVDAVQKKVAFLLQVKAELGLDNATPIHGRVERLQAPLFDIVLSRAFAPLEETVRLTRHLLRPDGLWLAMKGAYPTEEIGALDGTDVEVVRAVTLRVPLLDAERHLVILRFRQSDARHL